MSIAKTYSATTLGLEALPVEIEADLSNGLPGFNIVGLPDKAVEESKERVRAALKNNGLTLPQRRITINLAPADLKKEGPIFDLGIAVAILLSSAQISLDEQPRLFLGELALDGKLRHTNGILPISHYASQNNIKEIYIPYDNRSEAAIIEGIDIYPVKNIFELYLHLRGEKPLLKLPMAEEVPSEDTEPEVDISLIRGQETAKRALEIAAAGGHNLLFSGPPGSGKTMLAKTLAGLLPAMDLEEMIEVTKIYSVAGLLSAEKPLVRMRPFRSPHHTSSDISLVGGGRWPRPGEITLSHRGVLFLDELPEFSRSVLEVMRQPLEEGKVNIARAAQSLSFPAQFILIASQNPCPCGYLGDTAKNCVCTPVQIARYQKKISGPLLDRIDIHLEVPRVEVEKLTTKTRGEGSAEIRKRVAKARKIQTTRFEGRTAKTNSEMSQKDLEELAYISDEGLELLKEAARALSLSARSFFRTQKLARTIADLDGSSGVEKKHIAEALQYRAR